MRAAVFMVSEQAEGSIEGESLAKHAERKYERWMIRTSKKLKSGPFATEHPSNHRPRVQPKPHCKVRCVRPKSNLEFWHDVPEALQTITSKSSHHNGMVLARFRKTGNSHVAIADRLHLQSQDSVRIVSISKDD